MKEAALYTITLLPINDASTVGNCTHGNIIKVIKYIYEVLHISSIHLLIQCLFDLLFKISASKSTEPIH